MNTAQLVEFASRHVLLVMAFIALLAVLVGGEVKRRLSGVQDVGPNEATRMLNHEDAVLVDMRIDKDFSAGHISNAVHVPANDSNAAGRLEKFRERPLIVYCRDGNRSSGFCRQLRKQGFATVYNLKGGINAWQQANLPLSKAK